MSSNNINLSLIVPVYNEEAVLPVFFKQTQEALKNLKLNYEILFINDGSKDLTEAVILGLKKIHPEIAYAKFSRNFGKEAAMTAGFNLCKGEAAIVIDADLQDSPILIPEMVDAWKKGADIVNMKRSPKREGDRVWKRVTAALFYRLIGRIGEIEILNNVGDFRLFSRRAIDAINKLNERGRFMKGLYAWVGYPQTTIEYKRDKRAAGHTKWPFFKLLGLAWQGITAFSTVPLQIATWLGLISAGGAFLYAIYFLVVNLFSHDTVQGFPTLIIVILLLGGLQLFCMGILGEYIGCIYREVKQRPHYLIEDYKASE